MAKTVIGFFDSAADAQNAVQQLISSGFSRENIDVSTGNAATTDVSNTDYREGDREHESGITRFFKSLFGDDDDEARTYTRIAERGGSIVTVHAQTSEEAERAADLLDSYGAIDVDKRAAEYGYTSNTVRDTTAREDVTSDRINTASDRETSIPRIEEELNVGKRTVERGGVRVRSRIVERPVEENVRLREERVRVERNPVDRPVTEADLSNFKEGEIELTERAEVPVVNKQARVVEEVRLTKDVEEREETIRDTVRNTEVDIENINRGDRSDDYTTERRDDYTSDSDRTTYRSDDRTV